MKAREVLLLILIVFVGVLLYQANTGGLKLDWDWDGPIGSRTFDFEESLTLEAPVPAVGTGAFVLPGEPRGIRSAGRSSRRARSRSR